MTSSIETLNAINTGELHFTAETEKAASLAAFAQNILSAGTGTNVATGYEFDVSIAEDVNPHLAAEMVAGIGNLALR